MGIEKPYQPSPEEMQKAEKIMTEEQKEKTKEREFDILRRENMQEFEDKAAKRNEGLLSRVSRVFGKEKISGIDVAHEEALRDNNYIDLERKRKEEKKAEKLNKILNDARDLEKKREEEEEEEERGITNPETYPKLRLASVNDYTKWLKGYFLGGGKITHVYDYDMPKDFYVATKNFKMSPSYGSESFNIIVPRDIKFLGGELGHCKLYFEDGYKNTGDVPIYKNIKF